MKFIKINCKKPYFVYVGEKIIFKIGKILRNKLKYFCKIVVITDCLVFKLYGKIVRKNLEENGFLVFFFVLKNGENSKNLENVKKIYSFLFKINISKKDLIFALGGGMVCDFSGFVSSTYKRGINLVSFPTTLLSQVDASIGGKNGVNLYGFKNLVGTINSPFIVFCDIFFLKTLSKKEVNCGVAEIVKYAVCFSKNFFDVLLKKDIMKNLEEIILKCINIKKNVIEKDEFEDNFRMKLNFGHTLGHALEKRTNFKISHGEAISIGMCYITRCSFKAGLTKFEDFLKLKFILRKFMLPTVLNFNIDEIFKYILLDKKIFGFNINFCIMKKIGECEIFSCSTKKFKEFLKG